MVRWRPVDPEGPNRLQMQTYSLDDVVPNPQNFSRVIFQLRSQGVICSGHQEVGLRWDESARLDHLFMDYLKSHAG